MTVDTWLELIEKEEAQGMRHIFPCGGNLPRPEERGCDCPTCSKNRAIWKRGRRSAGTLLDRYSVPRAGAVARLLRNCLWQSMSSGIAWKSPTTRVGISLSDQICI